jgi:hypothetical protein
MFLVPQTNLGLGNAQKIETLREYLFSVTPSLWPVSDFS